MDPWQYFTGQISTTLGVPKEALRQGCSQGNGWHTDLAGMTHCVVLGIQLAHEPWFFSEALLGQRNLL